MKNNACTGTSYKKYSGVQKGRNPFRLRYCVILLSLPVLSVILFYLLPWRFVLVSNRFLEVELSITPDEWRQGLSDRDSPSAEGGMLFLLPYPQRPVFWMRDMHFAIDLVWLRDGRICGMEKNLLPARSGEMAVDILPPCEVDAVWEIPAGLSAELGLKKDARIYYLNFSR